MITLDDWIQAEQELAGTRGEQPEGSMTVNQYAAARNVTAKKAYNLLRALEGVERATRQKWGNGHVYFLNRKNRCKRRATTK